MREQLPGRQLIRPCKYCCARNQRGVVLNINIRSVSEYSEVRSSLSFSVFPEFLNISFANSENPLRFCLISPRYISRFDYYSSSLLR